MTESRFRRQPGLWLNIGGTLVIWLGLSIFGGINIEQRIIITALAFLGTSCIGWVLWFFGVTGPRVQRLAQITIFPVMLLFWIGQSVSEAVRESAVIPTGEYDELYPRGLYPRSWRRAELTEKTEPVFSDSWPNIDGATSLRDLYSSLADSASGGHYRGGLDCSRTGEAYTRLLAAKPKIYWKIPDVIFVFRPSKEQLRMAADAGRELHVTPIGYDAFVFFVNAGNPVTSLTAGQLRDIYAGRMTSWSEAGGGGERILPFQRYEGSGSQSGMERFMEDDTLMEPEREHRYRFMRGIVANTARYRNLESAVGYSFLYYVGTMLEGGGVRLLSVDGVLPSRETVQDGSYPIIEEICAVTTDRSSPAAHDFVRWILSPPGQAIVEAIGYIPVTPASPENPFPDVRVREQ